METSSVHVNLKHGGGSVVRGKARTHSVVVDRPHAKGGSDQGPMGGEFLLLGLGGCFLSTLLGAFKAEHDDFPTEAIEIAVTGTLVSMPSRFSEFTVDVYASETLKDRLAKSLLKAERGCIVHNTLKPATPVHFQYHWIDFPSVMPAPSAG